MKNNGFTLVELAIVLVIIGLLIGGILVAQSMIGTAKIQSQVRQILQFDAAVNNFKTKYNQLPGDASVMGCVNAGFSVCNNGRIEDDFYSGNPWGYSNEMANFWPQLERSGFKSEKGTLSATISGNFSVTSATPNSPQATLEPTAGFIAGSSMYGPTWTMRIIYLMADYSGITLVGHNIQNYGKHAIRPVDALALDKKMDDGLAEAGAIYAAKLLDNNPAYFGHGFGSSTTNYGGNATCNVTNVYTVTNTGKNCGLAIQMLSAQGGQ